MAMAFLAGTLAVNDPPETANLSNAVSMRRILHTKGRTYASPVHSPDELVPLITSQYVPSGRDVWNVELHTVSALLIATYPAAPVAV